MKRVFLLAAVFSISQAVSAQIDSIPGKADTAMHKMGFGVKEYYITLQAGQVMLVREGKAQKLDADKQLKDGTIVTTDGKVKKTDGTTVLMKEGDRIYLEGGMRMGSKDQKE